MLRHGMARGNAVLIRRMKIRSTTVAIVVVAAALLGFLAITLHGARDASHPPSIATPSVAPPSALPAVAAKPVEGESAAHTASAARPTSTPSPRPAIASPDVLRADAFRRVVDASLHECLPSESVVGLACDDPLCAAVIRVGPRPPAGQSLHSLGDCATWQRAYGGTTGAGYIAVPCPDGHDEILEVIHPEPDAWDGWYQLSDPDKERILRSLQDRAQELVDDQACKR
ncbi:MAG TPA: hypothetical protein VIV40_13575 [Kofleriaceae bacterium]